MALKDFPIGQYMPGDSVLHRLDPRTKIVLSLAMIVLLFVVEDFWGFLVMGVFSVLAVALARLPLRRVIKALRPVLIILLFTFALHLFMTPGEALTRMGPLTITREGLYKGFFLATRLILLILSTSLLTLTTSPISLTDGLEYLLKPFRRLGVPAHELAMMITIALRFIPTLLGEADKIMKAQTARGADFESGNIIQRARGLVPLLVPLFIGAFRRADDLAMAMEARAYRGGEGRTRFRQLTMARRDYAAVTVISILAGLLIWSRIS